MRSWLVPLVSVLVALLVGVACAPAAAPAPTAAPPKPTAAPAAPAQPTAVPAQPTAAPAATKPAAPAATAPAAAPPKPAATGPSEALIAAAKAEGSLILYTNMGRETVQLAADEFTKKYGIKVDLTRKSGPDIIQMVDAERRAGKIRTDLLGGGNATQGTLWAQQGIFTKFQPEAASRLAPEFRDSDGFWTSMYLTLSTAFYSTARIKKEDVPKTYKELTDPRWKGKLATVRSRGSGTGGAFVNVLSNLYGWSWFEDLAKNEPILLTSVSALPPLVINGEADILFPLDEDIGGPLVTRGEPLGFLYPSDVIPVSVNPWGLTKDGAHPNAAKLFLEFMLNDDIQAAMFKSTGARPMNLNAAPLPGMPALKDLKLKTPDDAWMSKHLSEQDDKFDSIFKGIRVRS